MCEPRILDNTAEGAALPNALELNAIVQAAPLGGLGNGANMTPQGHLGDGIPGANVVA